MTTSAATCTLTSVMYLKCLWKLYVPRSDISHRWGTTDHHHRGWGYWTVLYAVLLITGFRLQLFPTKDSMISPYFQSHQNICYLLNNTFNRCRHNWAAVTQVYKYHCDEKNRTGPFARPKISPTEILTIGAIVLNWSNNFVNHCWPFINSVDLQEQHDDVIKWKHLPRYWPFCEVNPPVTGGFPSQRLVARSFDVSFNPRLNKRLDKQTLVIWDAIVLIMTSL